MPEQLSPCERGLQRLVADRIEATGRNPFEAARIGGLERSFVRDILTGRKTTVRSNNLRKLALALDVSEAELVEAMMGGDGGGELSSTSEGISDAVSREAFLAFAEAMGIELGLDIEVARSFAKAALASALRPPNPRVAAPALEQARLRALDFLEQFPLQKGRRQS